MGYQSYFSWQIFDENEDEIQSTLKYEEALSQFFQDEYGYEYWPIWEGAKWYDYVEDMKKFSTKYPNLFFLMQREGEDAGDWTRLYVHDGVSYETLAQIDWPDFDLFSLANKKSPLE
jgi:hypothetical protein